MHSVTPRKGRAAAHSSAGFSELGDFGITVEECLFFSPLDQAVVTAGHAGLSRRLNWVHVVDHRDMEDSIETHELLLTSGIALASDETFQRDIFEIMDRKRSAGLVISIGEYITEVPQQMRELADLFEIPLIAIPWEVNFGDITRVLLSQFVESQFRFMELSQKLNHELLGIVIEKGDLHAVCERVASVVGVGTAFCNESFKPQIVSETNLAEGVLDERVLRMALSAGTLNRSGDWAASQVLSLDGQIIGVAAPIRVADRRRGYIVTEIGRMSPGVAGRIAESAATFAALVIAHEDELLRVARRSDGQLIGLLDGTLSASVATLGEIGLKSTEPVRVMVAVFETGDMTDILDSVSAFLRGRIGAIALTGRGRSILGLIQSPRKPTSEWSSALAEHLRSQGLKPVIGVSGATATLADISAKHEDVLELMRLRHYLQPDEDVINAEHATVLLSALRNLIASSDLQDICPAILRIKEHDRSLHGSLIEALGCLLEVDWNVSLAARRLGIHRHTVLYRLERIQEILGTEPKGLMRFELRLQLLAWRIAGHS